MRIILIALAILLFLVACRSFWIAYSKKNKQVLFFALIPLVFFVRSIATLKFSNFSILFLDATPTPQIYLHRIYFISIRIAAILVTYYAENAFLTAKSNQDNLEQSERLFRLLMEQSPIAIQIANKDGLVTQVNSAWEKVWQVDRSKVIEKYNLFKDQQLKKLGIDELLRRVFKGEHVQFMETLYTPKESYQEGRARWVQGYIYPIQDEKKKIHGIVLLTEDITDQHHTQQALVESEDRWSQLVENYPEAILISVDQVFVYCNPATIPVFGANSRDDIVGSSIYKFNNEGRSGTLLNRLKVLEEGGSLPPIEHVMVGLDGVKRDLISFSIPITYQGRKAIQTVIRDVTQRNREQALLHHRERLATVGQMAAGIAHDFNNALSVITLYSEILLKNRSLSEKDVKRVETIHQQANRAASLTSQILDYSRQSILKMEPVALLPIVEQFVHILESTLPENIKINLVKLRDSNYVIEADQSRLHQLFMNIALNGRDAMPNGGKLTITLNAFAHDESFEKQINLKEKADEWVQIRFADTGYGIEEDDLDHLFEPFFTTKERNKGTGLGLAQVYGIVSQHRGNIRVESEIGKGATFIVTFPSATLPLEKTAVSLTSPILCYGQQERVLIVEDHENAQQALAEILQSLNYEVVIAQNGFEALNIIQQQDTSIDLVLSDVVMPEMDGQKMLVELRKSTITLPVLFMTGHPLNNRIAELQQYGISGYLQKPLNIETLSEALYKALNSNGR